MNKPIAGLGGRSVWLPSAILIGLCLLGAGLRWTQLAAKPPWNDELATLVFSLGNSLLTIPIDQPLSLDRLLAPLQPNPSATFADVAQRLYSESTHPPVYFWLTHAWLKLFSNSGPYVSVWAARSLSALFGTIAIPCMDAVGRAAFRSRWTGLLAAALMALSPYGVYLSQEARHYTLAILLILASLRCWVAAIRHLQAQKPLPYWLCAVWVGCNSLGIAVHYFYSLVLVAEAIGLLALAGRQRPKGGQGRWAIVVLGTAIGGLIWLPSLQTVSGNELTHWIYDPVFLRNPIGPLYRLVAWMVSMVMLLPIEGVPLMLAIGSVLLLLGGGIWLGGFSRAGWKRLQRQADRAIVATALLWLIVTLLAILLLITYGYRADLTIAARYQFVYFPSLLLLLGGSLAAGLADRSRPQIAVGLLPVLLLGLLGSLCVVTNYGYQKPDRPDQLVPIIQQTSQVPVLIATTHETHEQIRQLMGLGLEYRRQGVDRVLSDRQPQFLLVQWDPEQPQAERKLNQIVAQIQQPFDLWTVNFLPDAQPVVDRCNLDTADRPRINGYDYRLYHCPS